MSADVPMSQSSGHGAVTASDTPLTSDNDTETCENGGAAGRVVEHPPGHFPTTRLNRERG